MTRVLMYARDPGSANVILPVFNEIKNYNHFLVSLFAKDFAMQRFDREGVDYETLLVDSVEKALVFLKKKKPNIIITGSSLDDFTERYLWKASELLHIPSYAIMDQWILLGIRFSQYDYSGVEEYRRTLTHDYFPRRILVMDDAARNRLIEDNIPETSIAVTGQPHFDNVKKRFELAELKQKAPEIKTIIFASEPKIKDGEVGHLGYSEKTIFNFIFEAVKLLSDKYKFRYALIIRPHPRESLGSWSDIINNYSCVYVDRETDSFTMMKNADLVCGMSSMFLVESAICKVPIVSCLIGLKSESPFVFDQIGAYNSCRNTKELYRQIKKVLVDGEPTDLRVEFIENATERTIHYILEDVENASIGH